MSAPRAELEYLDALERLAANAADVGRSTVCLTIGRDREPKGRARLAGRSGPLSTTRPHYSGHGQYTGFWSCADVREWCQRQRVYLAAAAEDEFADAYGEQVTERGGS